MDSNTHSTSHAGPGWRRWPPSSRSWPPRPGPAERRHPGRAGPGVATAGRAPGRPLAGRAGRPGRPGGRRGGGGRPGRLHRRLAPPPPPHEPQHCRRLCADRSGAVPWPPHPTGQALTEGAISPAHAQVLAHDTQDLPDQSPPRPNRCWWRRPGGSTRRGCGGSSPICGWWLTLRVLTPRPNAGIGSGGVAVVDLGGDGRGQRAAGGRGWPDLGGRLGAVGPPDQRPR